MDTRALVSAARKAKQFSFSPYSKFRVGAALLTVSGEIVTGCNIENSSFSLTICAERTALFKAISDGNKKFRAIAIATDAGQFIPPCGACRQVIQDLAGNIVVILTDNKGRVKQFTMEDFLPMPFNKRMLKH